MVIAASTHSHIILLIYVDNEVLQLHSQSYAVICHSYRHLLHIYFTGCQCDDVADHCNHETGACLCRVQGAIGDRCERFVLSVVLQ